MPCWQSSCCRALGAVAFMAAANGLIDAQPGNGPAKREPSDSLKKITLAGGGPQRDTAITTHMYTGVELIDGQPVAFGANATPNFLSLRTNDYHVYFPPLRKDDIVPLFGFLYRVTELRNNTILKGSKNTDVVVLEWIKDEDAPGKVRLRSDSFLVPLRQGQSAGHVLMNNTYVTADKIVARKNEPKYAPWAFVYVTAPLEASLPNPPRAIINEGDVLVVGDKGFKVRSIVPRDSETKLIGWIDFDSTPIPLNELAKHKAVVRPEPSK